MASSLDVNHQADECSDEDYPSDNDSAGFKSLLKAWLDQVRTAGSFATAGLCPTVPIPVLNVEGLGTVGLPLTDNTAKAIINSYHRAPFGKGTSTLRHWGICADPKLMGVQEMKPLNESVRKTWELDPTKFSFQNLNWEPSVQKIASTVAHALGYAEEASIRADPHKLLLYEEGAMFRAHQE